VSRVGGRLICALPEAADGEGPILEDQFTIALSPSAHDPLTTMRKSQSTAHQTAFEDTRPTFVTYS
jgi:hypothetical protein